MADHELEVNIYPAPNPALTEILVGEDMARVVNDYGQRVKAQYVSDVQARAHKGDPHPGALAASAYCNVFVGGMKNDRYVAEVGSALDYAASDEFGRSSRNPYHGHHSLRDALFSLAPNTL
ncbi:HK97 gp10 family phage protein [Mycobacterium arosiense]|uniref:Uncharacterized protein n=1 Tax=Mycobacterium arosiense ATCC BAA-1401 = DSM 45069 TaxID=1265311 RepID=A0A1W9ZKK7_MYCAI|nr:HK97 gp10 family phage protein [Mycobacterium arosiense]ORA17360.1 hypothetical protein BST14_08795 [Mycobacterium arosiense ATCC BAA-1401 = DSM 45069]